MRVENGYKPITNSSAVNYGLENEEYEVFLDPTEAASLREARANAENFNNVMKERYKVADEIIRENAKLGPDEPIVNKLKLNEEWFKDFDI